MNRYYERAFEALERIAGAEDFQHDYSSELRELRKRHYLKMTTAGSEAMVKVAFDTRRFNPETDVNPRRNLQNYQRSEAFIDKESSEKIKTFFKLKTAVDSVKEDFVGDPDWHDSYCRILSAALDRTLRVEQQDMDFFKPQLDYLEEMMYLRYRLSSADIVRMSEREIRNVLVDRDEKLLHKTLYSNYREGNVEKSGRHVTLAAPMINGTDLIEQLFGNVKASKDQKSVERTVTITIKDSYVEPEEETLKVTS